MGSSRSRSGEDDGGFGDAGIDSLEGGVGGWEELVAGHALECGAGTGRGLEPDLRTVVEFPCFEVGDAAVVPFEAVDEEGGLVEFFDAGEAIARPESRWHLPALTFRNDTVDSFRENAGFPDDHGHAWAAGIDAGSLYGFSFADGIIDFDGAPIAEFRVEVFDGGGGGDGADPFAWYDLA